MNVLASATFDGENHLLTNQSQLEISAVDVRTRASSSATGTCSILYKLDLLRPGPHFRLIHRTF
jgi:hypothetical protein